MTRSSSSPSPWKSRRLIAVIGAFTTTALLFSLVLFPNYLPNLNEFILLAPIATAVTTWLVWGFLVERNEHHGIVRGILVGGLIGIAAHYVCWYLFAWYAFLSTLITEPTKLGTVINPLNALWLASGPFLLGMTMVGWITTPIAMALGAVCGRSWVKH